MMKNKKLYHACMASILSAAMLLTSVPVSAAEFTSGDTAEEVAAALAEQGEPIPAEEAEDASQISAKAASDVVQIDAHLSQMQISVNMFLPQLIRIRAAGYLPRKSAP